MKRLIALLVALVPSSAWAGCANLVLSDCEQLLQTLAASGDKVRYRDSASAGECSGFITAVREMNAMLSAGQGKPGLGYCAPSKSDGIQAIRVFVHYAQTHPGQPDRPAVALILDAFRDAWPCPKGVETTQGR